jgi:DNA repair exonuclease SbcCD ATPase subunit
LEGKEVDFEEFSSGQKARLEMAVAFSLFYMARVFFSSGLNFLVFDEILDMNLDSSGVDSVLDILEGIAKDSSVFLVTHKSELKDRFDNYIEVKLLENETVVKDSNE